MLLFFFFFFSSFFMVLPSPIIPHVSFLHSHAGIVLMLLSSVSMLVNMNRRPLCDLAETASQRSRLQAWSSHRLQTAHHKCICPQAAQTLRRILAQLRIKECPLHSYLFVSPSLSLMPPSLFLSCCPSKDYQLYLLPYCCWLAVVTSC